MEAIQKRVGSALMGNRFFIMTQVGAIMLLIASFSPVFPAYLAVAAVALGIAVAWDLWRGRTKLGSYVFAGIILAFFVFLLVNTLTMSIVPAALHESEATLAGLGGIVMGGGNLTSAQTFGGIMAVAGLTQPIIAMLIGGIANVLFLIAGIAGIMAARMME